MPDTLSRFHTDAWIDQDAQHKSHGKGSHLWVRAAGSQHGRRVLMMVAKPFPHNDALVIVEATLKMYVRDASDWVGSTTLHALRIDEAWRENRVNWNNQPGLDTNPNIDDELTVVNPAGGQLIEFDVTDHMDQIASHGAEWYGLEIRSDRDEKVSFWSSDSSNERYAPRLYVRWALGAYPPTKLHPSGSDVIDLAQPTLHWKYTPRDGSPSTQSASQVQISSDRDNFGAHIVYDSGAGLENNKNVNTHHRWSLVGEYTVPNNQKRWWRVRTWDDNNRMTGWSNVVSFIRIAKGVLEITDPGVEGIVSDLTPTIVWQYSGTQTRARLNLKQQRDDGTWRDIWERQDRKQDDNELTIWTRHKRPVIQSGEQYDVQIYVWDDQDRSDSNKDPSYIYAHRRFHYERDGRPDPVETLTVTPADNWSPAVNIKVTRANTPDWFCLKIDGKEAWHFIDPDDFEFANGDWRFRYWGLIPRHQARVEVEAVDVISGKHVHSKNNPEQLVTTNPKKIWIVDEDDGMAVDIEGSDGSDLTIGELATTYDRVANRRPVRIRDEERGLEGSFSGRVKGDANRDRFLILKGRMSEKRLIAANLSLIVEFEDASISPTPLMGGDEYDCSFSILQVDDFWAAD